MACAKGLKSSRSGFWKLVRNPVYCGLIPLSQKEQPLELIKGIHEPLISESLFNEVQAIINTKRKITSKSDEVNNFFFLRGFLTCPLCERKLHGSFSKGSSKKYPYYHCSRSCKLRVRADLINDCYNKELQKLLLSNGAKELFRVVLEDLNIRTQKTEYLKDRRILTSQLEEQQLMLLKIRKLFVDDKLKFDDFRALKTEYQATCNNIGMELKANSEKLRLLDKQFNFAERSLTKIFSSYSDLDAMDKKYIVSLIVPVLSDFKTGMVSLKFNKALMGTLSSIIPPQTFHAPSSNTGLKTFAEKKVSIKHTISIMENNKVRINENDAAVVLDFLYCMAKTYHFDIKKQNRTLRKTRTREKPNRQYPELTI